MQSTWNNNIDVAIIMDGNGRWATRRGLPRHAGHHAGVSALRETVVTACELRLASLTVYAFSSDNWKRPAREVAGLMGLLRRYLQRELADLVANGVRLSVIGRRDRLTDDLLAYIQHAETVTKEGRRLHLRIAFDYSARHAITQAVRGVDQNTLCERAVSRAITKDKGPSNIDLLIRTGGEQRLSDFLLWEAAYAELYFCNLLWPDFDGAALRSALGDFHQRNRRFGGLPDVVVEPGQHTGHQVGGGRATAATYKSAG